MAALFARALRFVTQNKSIFITLLLVVFIPAAFFFNVYRINQKYEKNIDSITRKKAILAEQLINIAIVNNFSDPAQLQGIIDGIMTENSEIKALDVLKREGDGFVVIASNVKDEVGTITQNIQNTITWDANEGIAMLNRNSEERYWNVTNPMLDKEGKKIGLITMAFSLKETDAQIQKTIEYSYGILFATLIIVVLLVANQARLIGHVLALTKLKEIDKMKDMFISMASHELRSPLTAMKGYIEFLKESENVASDSDTMRYTQNLDLSVDRLNTLVNDMLEVSRLEGNRLPIEIKSFDPFSAVKQVVEELKPQAIKKNLSIVLEDDKAKALMLADENRLKQVLVNLIGNAIKYTAKGSVTISSAIKGNMYAITVADTGFGISSENQKNLFQKFYRVQDNNTSGIVGTGLGLWITNEIVKRMDGKISIESIEGVGSHFTVLLPIGNKS